jgi:hypothetical protein
MQTKTYLAIFTALIYLFVQVDAACNCAAEDTTCLQKCGKVFLNDEIKMFLILNLIS